MLTVQLNMANLGFPTKAAITGFFMLRDVIVPESSPSQNTISSDFHAIETNSSGWMPTVQYVFAQSNAIFGINCSELFKLLRKLQLAFCE
ncbi:hypothetical protein [Noviherbaspirillum sp.]|uniref:hypothetical protein n=1 Tax=Noviherbaspirillum sp. TaxID=1926288 RepID=UPI002FE35117